MKITLVFFVPTIKQCWREKKQKSMKQVECKAMSTLKQRVQNRARILENDRRTFRNWTLIKTVTKVFEPPGDVRGKA